MGGGGLGWGATEGTPLGERDPPSPVSGLPCPSPSTCNKEIMPFLILYLPRMPVIFFLSESNFLLTFLPNVAKLDLCERTLLQPAPCLGPPKNSGLLFPQRRARVPTLPGPLLGPRLLLPVGEGAGHVSQGAVNLGFPAAASHGSRCSALEPGTLFQAVLELGRELKAPGPCLTSAASGAVVRKPATRF